MAMMMASCCSAPVVMPAKRSRAPLPFGRGIPSQLMSAAPQSSDTEMAPYSWPRK
jgi:hypothetical protein